MAKYNKQQIIQILKNLATQLGKNSLSLKEVSKVIPISAIKYRFGNLGNALEEAGLERVAPGQNLRQLGKRITNNELFEALYDVEIILGKEPGYNDCSAKCKYSTRPYSTRFGHWSQVLTYYRKWKEENGLRGKYPKEESNYKNEYEFKDNKALFDSSYSYSIKGKTKPQQYYGEPIDFRGLRHAPINEQGVVFLFAIISSELGFYIESVQQGFPDCEGKYCCDTKKDLWAKARIEFEYKASNFKQHGHDPDKCDFMVCWENDWPECPLKVIELKSEILKLPSK